MKSSPAKTILLLVAIGLTLVSTHFVAPCDVTPPSDGVANDLPVAYIFADSGCDNKAGHDNGHCSEPGCQDCCLTCCVGSAMILAIAPIVDPALNIDERMVATAAELSWVDPDRLYHPPRA